MGKLTGLLFAVLVGYTFSFGCATPRYQPPKADRSEVLSERLRQAEIRNAAKKEQFRQLVQDAKTRKARLIDLATPIRLAGVQLSTKKQVWREFGFHFTAADWWGRDIERYKQEVFFEEYEIKQTNRFSVTIWHVMKGLPAEQAGLCPGDRIIAVNNKVFKSSKDFRDKLILDAEGNVIFNIVRNDTTYLTLKIPTMPISKFEIQYSEDERINAYADGETMYIMKGLMDFVQSDRELQLIIAHELAHNIEGHIGKTKTNSLLGGVLGGAVDGLITAYTGIGISAFGRAGANIGAHVYSKEFEREADYLAMYLLANAGIPIDGVADFWRKMSELSDSYSRTHPSHAERFVNLIAIDQEIQAKRTQGMPIMPNKE